MPGDNEGTGCDDCMTADRVLALAGGAEVVPKLSRIGSSETAVCSTEYCFSLGEPSRTSKRLIVERICSSANVPVSALADDFLVSFVLRVVSVIGKESSFLDVFKFGSVLDPTSIRLICVLVSYSFDDLLRCCVSDDILVLSQGLNVVLLCVIAMKGAVVGKCVALVVSVEVAVCAISRFIN